MYYHAPPHRVVLHTHGLYYLTHTAKARTQVKHMNKLYVVRNDNDTIKHQGYDLSEALTHLHNGYIEVYQQRELIDTVKVANGKEVKPKIDVNPFGLRT